MTSNKKSGITRLLKGIETGEPDSVIVVNEEKYIQHNPQTQEGSEGLAALFKRLSKTSPRVNLVRVFEDGDFVFAHTEYDFASRNIGFEIFRFEDGQAVEHWDNIQKRKGPNLSNHSMVDGGVEIIDVDRTEANRTRIKSFVKQVLVEGNTAALENYIDSYRYVEHNPSMSDDVDTLCSALSAQPDETSESIDYQHCHRILAEGNFVLSVCEGYVNQQHSSFYDLYRLENERIVEHWDTRESIAPKSEWKNDNGKF
ncbi:MAG: nuclear transport factor 2 family protein [Kangiellaceae bacterium]|nr:nuclear transport factor 2 family protein [Kangiellaceae bacterium]